MFAFQDHFDVSTETEPEFAFRCRGSPGLPSLGQEFSSPQSYASFQAADLYDLSYRETQNAGEILACNVGSGMPWHGSKWVASSGGEPEASDEWGEKQMIGWNRQQNSLWDMLAYGFDLIGVDWKQPPIRKIAECRPTNLTADAAGLPNVPIHEEALQENALRDEAALLFGIRKPLSFSRRCPWKK